LTSTSPRWVRTKARKVYGSKGSLWHLAIGIEQRQGHQVVMTHLGPFIIPETIEPGADRFLFSKPLAYSDHVIPSKGGGVCSYCLRKVLPDVTISAD
jgi:hypothetical protein